MARRSQFPGRTRSKRSTAWGIGPNAVDMSFTGTSSQLLTTGVSLAVESRATIVRVRGALHLILTAATAAGDGFRGAFGMGIVSNKAFTAGVASVPTPLSQVSWPGWIVHRYFDIRALTGTLGDGANAESASLRLDIDSKGMRKFADDEIFVGVFEVVESGTAVLEVQGDTRQLFKFF